MARDPDAPDKRAVFVVGYKGGTGKSMVARALLDRYRRDDLPVVAYDGDGRVGHLIQYYGLRDGDGRLLPDQRAPGGVRYFEARDAAGGRTRLIDALDDGAERLLVDLPGGIVGEVATAISDSATAADVVAEYRSAGYALTVVMVLSTVLASARVVKTAIGAFGPAADYVVVLNALYGKPDPEDSDFLFYHGFADGTGRVRGGEGRKALLASRGVELVMPALRPRVISQIDADNLTFAQARHDPRLVRSAQRHVDDWLKRMDGELDKARSILAL